MTRMRRSNMARSYGCSPGMGIRRTRSHAAEKKGEQDALQAEASKIGFVGVCPARSSNVTALGGPGVFANVTRRAAPKGVA